VQLPYSDTEDSNNTIDGILYGIQMLYEEIIEKKIPEGRRLLVVHSPFYGNGWAWIDGKPGAIDPANWHRCNHQTLLEALKEIRKYE
jgi:hypothetical protein